MKMRSMLRQGLGALLLLAAINVQAAIQLVPVVAAGLSSPVFVGHAGDGTGRLFIVEQTGALRVLQPGASAPTLFLNLATKIIASGERGLLGLAFHPQYGANGRFFVYYTRAGDGALVVAEYRVSANRDVADPAETVLLVIPHPTNTNHNGGMLAFGADGFLYIGVGDGGSGNDPPNNAQNIETLLGKILRIDVDRADPVAGTPYASPPGNPFVGVAGRDEIYAYGLRNPWRFSFDRATGQQWVGDVGQGQREEVDTPIVAGGNYGWRVYEGTACTGVDPALCNPANYLPPLFEYTHGGGRCSLTGGYVYRGTHGALPSGTYVFGDYCSGEIFAWNAGVQSILADTPLNISSFGEDEAGELYVVALGGSVSRIAAASSATTTTLASSANPATAGAPVTFTATVAGANPTGSVAFTDAGATIAGCGAVALTGTGNSPAATCTTSALAAGAHSIVARYGGDAANASSTSTPLTQQINGSGSSSFANGGFEIPALGSGFQYGPVGTGIAWTFASGGGIQGNGSAWRAATAPEGTQTAFVQNLGRVAQAFTLGTGNYTLSFKAARRAYSMPASTGNPLTVTIDGQAIGTPVAPPGTAFTTYTIPFTIAGTGTHTLQFAGSFGGGDATTFLDAVAITPAAVAIPVANSGFETPALGTGFQYGPTGTGVGWTFGSGGGIQGNGSAWRATAAPEGSQTAFLQNLGSVAQSLTLAAGNYTLAFKAARRPYASPAGSVNPVRVTVDGQAVGTLVSPPTTAFTAYSVAFSIANGGTHTIQLSGTFGGGDATTLIDTVTVSR